ncbi:hypothetical protein RFI_02592 [Reticulomyxa filosa]|uniref:Uncharacterized protein n=1 Tax=Reticulomyxa filosa TaxID=46433 RepID=X6PA24_RETFI|nr:hypothetical protein RFI_02592 [Reticulomyxa filosa]|eukprot:ETO34502.1 hypothetical protein RFI_02592 [Reticulomyxa filosa]
MKYYFSFFQKRKENNDLKNSIQILQEKKKNLKKNKRTAFFLSECYSKSWISLTNEAQRLNTLICCICNQIVNNAMELNCGEHENEEKFVWLEKNNNGKYPIQQHGHCEFSQGKAMKKLVSELLAICPRQFNLKKRRKRRRRILNKSNSNSKNICNFKGKIKDLKDHLGKSYNLISIKQINPLEIVNELMKCLDKLENCKMWLNYKQFCPISKNQNKSFMIMIM